jgi:hypothetical protein
MDLRLAALPPAKSVGAGMSSGISIKAIEPRKPHVCDQLEKGLQGYDRRVDMLSGRHAFDLDVILTVAVDPCGCVPKISPARRRS